MKKPNYGFAKRQKELKKQKKNEEKRLRRLNKSKETDETPQDPTLVAPVTNEPKPEEPVSE